MLQGRNKEEQSRKKTDPKGKATTHRYIKPNVLNVILQKLCRFISILDGNLILWYLEAHSDKIEATWIEIIRGNEVEFR